MFKRNDFDWREEREGRGLVRESTSEEGDPVGGVGTRGEWSRKRADVTKAQTVELYYYAEMCTLAIMLRM